MNEVFIVDICNTLANVNSELGKRGMRTDLYPSPVPASLWEDTSIFSDAAPIETVTYFVRQIGKISSEIFYLTARPRSLSTITEAWLKKHQLPASPIIYTDGKSKGEYMNRLVSHNQKAIVFEDSPNEIQSILTARSDSFLFIPDWTYNRHIDGHRISFSVDHISNKSFNHQDRDVTIG
jgi:hypothetical protein